MSIMIYINFKLSALLLSFNILDVMAPSKSGIVCEPFARINMGEEMQANMLA